MSIEYSDEVNCDGKTCNIPLKCSYKIKEENVECYYPWKIDSFSLQKLIDINSDNSPDENNESFPIITYRPYFGYKSPKAENINIIINYYKKKKKFII